MSNLKSDENYHGVVFCSELENRNGISCSYVDKRLCIPNIPSLISSDWKVSVSKIILLFIRHRNTSIGGIIRWREFVLFQNYQTIDFSHYTFSKVIGRSKCLSRLNLHATEKQKNQNLDIRLVIILISSSNYHCRRYDRIRQGWRVKYANIHLRITLKNCISPRSCDL